jgi:UDP-glucose 4-epimerase
MKLIEDRHLKGFDVYNVGTPDSITVTEIAKLVVEVLGLKNVCFMYTGGDRGWKGDVPVIKLDSSKIRDLGWKNKLTSQQAIYKSVTSIYKDALKNRFA